MTRTILQKSRSEKSFLSSSENLQMNVSGKIRSRIFGEFSYNSDTCGIVFVSGTFPSLCLANIFVITSKTTWGAWFDLVIKELLKTSFQKL